MDLGFTAEEEAFRLEVRDWLDRNLPAEWRHRGVGGFREEEETDLQRQWQRRLHESGWLKLAWSKQAGGREATPVMQAIYQEEMEKAGAPIILGRLGVSLLAPTLLVHGSQWQKDTYVEKILSGDLNFCQGFSEPDARSDPEVEAHKGISFFLIDIHQPGVEVRRIRQMTGGGEFCEIFLTNAVVEDRDVVGEPGAGWKIAMTVFGFERGGLAQAARFERVVAELAVLARDRGAGADVTVRQKVAQAQIEAHVFRLNGLRNLTKAQHGDAPGPEASLTKLYWSEMDKRIQESLVRE